MASFYAPSSFSAVVAANPSRPRLQPISPHLFESLLCPSATCLSVHITPLRSHCVCSSINNIASLRHSKIFRLNSSNFCISAAAKPEPLKIMIAGAPASGKGSQCEMIVKKYGLVHIAAGDLLRAEIAAGTENGKLAKEYMEKGMLVPNEIVVALVKERLQQPDVQQNGWLLDGYPRSLSQAKALEDLCIRPDIFILLDVNEETLVERVVGRRLDSLTGKIYHLKYSPPETEEIAARLVQRFDDTEEKVKLRLKTHHQNIESVLSLYEDVIVKVNGNLSKEDVFNEIDRQLNMLLEMKSKEDPSSMNTMIKEQLNADAVTVKDAYGDGRHVSIDVVSAAFEGQSVVNRQRMVYKAIWEELQTTVHAVDQMTTRTPAEAEVNI
ncbi:hypothetical protein HPP92_003741 [Vanilla planifolia]|uniref:adenylate kinase n=1 Tax=Vanilla planifolia TaxID=51239 RepID=A0A835S2C2_VANPL|nr:hypothetical protein HPP92_003741 [Vanilla planifolia]